MVRRTSVFPGMACQSGCKSALICWLRLPSTASFQRQLNRGALVGEVSELSTMVSEDFDEGPCVAATVPARESFIAEFGGADKHEAIDALLD